MGLWLRPRFCKQIEQDIPIWEARSNRDRPATGPRRRRDHDFPAWARHSYEEGNCVRSLNYDELFIGGRGRPPSDDATALGHLPPHRGADR